MVRSLEATEEISARYKFLFTLPSYRGIIYLIIILSLLFGGLTTYGLFVPLNVASPLNSFLATYFMYFFSAIAAIFLTNRIVEPKILTMRRLAGLSLFGLLYAGMLHVTASSIFLIFRNLRASLTTMLIGFGASCAIRYLVLRSMEGRRGRSIIGALTQPVIGIFFYELMIRDMQIPLEMEILRVFYVLGSFTIVSWFLLEAIDVYLKKTYGFDGLKFFQAFLKNWLLGEAEDLEKMLYERSEEDDVEIYIVEFLSKNNKRYAFIIPKIHFGPFRNVGSSELPAKIIKRLRERGIIGVVFHYATTHEKDLATSKDNEKILEEIIRELENKSKKIYDKATPILENKHGNTRVYCQILGETALIIVTRAPRTTDDLPIWVEKAITAKAQEKGFKEAILIDAHNSLNVDKPGEEDFLEVIKSVEKAFDKTLKLKRESLFLNISQIITSKKMLRMGLGEGGISSITIRIGSDEKTFIVFDGNNMLPEFREELLKRLEMKGFKSCELLTTDTHSVNALTTNMRGYSLIGEKENYEIALEYAEKTAMESKRELAKVNYSVRKIVIRGVRVLGKSILDELAKAINTSLKRAKKYAIVGYSIAFISSFLLGVI